MAMMGADQGAKRAPDSSGAARGRVVIVGGGIAGCSVAYHLARAGWRDVLLLEKGELTSGSTHHAAGLVTQFNPSSTMMRFRRQSVALYNELDVFNAVGSVRIASSHESLMDLERAVSRAAALGLAAELIGPDEVLRLMPHASPESLYGGVWMPEDGHVDPHIATHAVADAARGLGVEIRTRARVTGIRLGHDHQVTGVVTEEGVIETEHVVNAAGIWAPQVAEMVGARLPSVPVEHQHVLMQAVPGSEIPRASPCFRDPDNLVYGKDEAGGMLVGGYEHDPSARWTDGVPWDHGASPVESDMDRFAPLLEGAIRRFPFLEDSGVIRLLCHPDAMTPDGNPLLGPMPGTPGFWVAAGLSLNGFGGAGGMGRAVAEWMTEGAPELDVNAYRAWRFGGAYEDAGYASACAREAYRYYYLLRYPLDTAECGRGRRASPLQVRLQELGAVFGAKNGWERPDHFEPGSGWRRSGADQRAFGWARPPWFERVAAEHAAFRERVGIIDMTSFGKLEVAGPGALGLLERACDSRIDRLPGSVIYTQFLNRRGGIVADVTVTRLAEERFRVVTGAGTVDADRGWLELNRRADADAVEIRDLSAELAVIGIWGPRAREVLERCSSQDVSNEVLPFARARTFDIDGAEVLAQRITYVGELGYELYMAPRWAVQVWDRLIAAGAPHGITPGGYRALESLRLEKGYRYFGSDLTAGDTPYESGLGFCVHLDKREFNGRDALRAPGASAPARRLRTLAVGGEDYLPLYGGEAVRRDGEVVGRVRSCGYGYSVRRTVALATVPAELGLGSELTVDVFGRHAPAVLDRDALYDPEGTRIHA
jgi:glycine cleavage system aminomethyltransferase T/glycine/D-amino acid oxidase-like deaminating enzyme